MAVTGRIVLVFLVALFGASCSNGDGAGGGNTLLEGGRVATTGPLTTTTTAAPQPATTTTVAASPTTSVATVVSNETTTTTTSEVEVAARGTDSDGTPVQLTESLTNQDLFNDPSLEIASLMSGDTQEIVIPVQVGAEGARYTLSLKLRLDAVD